MQRHQRLVAGGAMHHLIGDQALWLGIAEHNQACKFVMFAQWAHQAEADAQQGQALCAGADNGASGDIAAGARAGHHAGIEQIYADRFFCPVDGEGFDEVVSAWSADPASLDATSPAFFRWAVSMMGSGLVVAAIVCAGSAVATTA